MPDTASLLRRERPSAASADGGRIQIIRGVMEFVRRHAVASSAAVALTVRLVITLVTRALTTKVVIPDEAQYISLARWMADGHDPNLWVPYFGSSLYRATRAFELPLVLIYRYISPARVAGQLVAIAFGVALVALTVWLVRQLVGVRVAVLAGLVIAFLPSQVLFSSVVLRESQVWWWLAVIAAACVLANDDSPRRQVFAILLAAAALVCLGALRDQTLFVACWVLVAAMVVSRRGQRVRRVVVALALVLVLPVLGDAGIGGWGLVQRAVPALARTRAQMSLDADSSFVGLQPITTTTTVPEGSSRPHRVVLPPTTPSSMANRVIVGSYSGQLYLVDESPGADLKALPAGLVGVLLRPWPWEFSGGRSLGLRMASLENLGWYFLYALAIIGAWSGFRRNRPLFAFPVLVCLGLTLSAAVSQGNLGTAFRHRGQMAWAIVLLAAEGWVVARRWWAARDVVPA